jgi:hypothetical protein
MKTKSKSRRAFLVAGVGGAGAAVAAVAMTRQAEPGVPEAPATKDKDGYRVTEHIQKYYKTTEV